MDRINLAFFKSLVQPRPAGSENNIRVQELLGRTGTSLGYEAEELPFDCTFWEGEPSCLTCGDVCLTVWPSPFSPAAEGSADLIFIETLSALRHKCKEITGKIVVLHGAIAAEPLMPKEFPFYEVAEHREIAELLESSQPLAVLSATGRHPVAGLDPCPMFEDCNFDVPSAYFPSSQLEMLHGSSHGQLVINSHSVPSLGIQTVFHKKNGGRNSAGTVMFCAHMDTAYGTPGALDNASGLYVLMKLMERMADHNCRYDLQFVPFNGEDHADVPGQRAYFNRYPDQGRLRLVINIDGVGLCGSRDAVSLYGISTEWKAKIEQVVEGSDAVVFGDPWYEGDHSMFTMQGVPAVAFVSSGLDGITAVSHTEKDTLEQVDFQQLECLVSAIYDMFCCLTA